MSNTDEIADSTDWLNTPLAGLAPLESSLRCQVCKDFFTTPMITSCSHTFCSLCIRRYLSQEGRCPACRETDQEMKLRRNWTVEELVAHFTQSRDQILAYGRRPPPQETEDAPRPKKRRKIESTINSTERRSTRSQSRRKATTASQASQEPLSTQEEVPDSDEEGSVYQGENRIQLQPSSRGQSKVQGPHDGLVQCPNCSRRTKEASINIHLDRCLQGLPTSPTPPPPRNNVPNGMTAAASSIAFAPRTKSPVVVAQKDRLPSMNYALYTETSLRKKLKELGIPSHGNKELMRKRHTEWMNLWNANCDSSQPKPKRDLLKELDTWERTLGRQVERGVTSGSSGVMVKDFDRDSWARNQKDEFDDLIKKAREKRAIAAAVNTRQHEQTSGEAKDGQMVDVTSMVATNGDSATSVGPHHSPSTEQDPDEPISTVIAGEESDEAMENDTRAMDQGIGDHLASATTISTGVPDTPRKQDLSAMIDLSASPAGKPADGSQTDIPRTPGKSRFFT